MIAFSPWISACSGAECCALLPEVDASRSVLAADGLDLVDVVAEVGGAAAGVVVDGVEVAGGAVIAGLGVRVESVISG